MNTDSDAHPFKSYTFAFASDDDPTSTDSGPLQLQIDGRDGRLTSKTTLSSGVEAIVEKLRQQIGVLAELPGMQLIYSGRFKAYNVGSHLLLALPTPVLPSKSSWCSPFRLRCQYEPRQALLP